MSKEDKSAHYIRLLDNSRCNGNWQEVPELVRKVTKHAPHRKCLILAARSEYEVAQYTRSRPTTTGSQKLHELITALAETVAAEDRFNEDALQAQVCLGWIHSVLNEPDLAVSRLPYGFIEGIGKADGGILNVSPWTKVCAVKGSYVRGAALLKTASAVEALNSFGLAIPLLSRLPLGSGGSEQRFWVEQFLSDACQISSAQAVTNSTRSGVKTTLSFFRIWARFWAGRPNTGSLAPEYGLSVTTSRRDIWKAYFEMISRIITTGLPYIDEEADDTADHTNVESLKLKQRSELQSVQNAYEGLLLREVNFPKAQEQNRVVEEWASQAIQNWLALTGDHWRDEDLGEGGKQAYSRHMLDVLYRAAAKTFHSTTVLRYLFTVHTSLGEFLLAFKAIDTYIEIITKSKAREIKSDQVESDIDEDDVILETAAQAISILCQYGRRREAERARDIGDILSSWIHTHKEANSATTNGFEDDQQVVEKSAWRGISSLGLEYAYCAIAISQANWARWTFDSSARTDIQLKSLRNFKNSLDISQENVESSVNLKARFGLCILLAEMQKSAQAIELIKSTLTLYSSKDDEKKPAFGDQVLFSRERELLPFWHLLSLLLSARQDFKMALRTCEAAYEQFQSPENLFGKGIDGESGSQSLDSVSEKAENLEKNGAVDVMESREKIGILQIKITEIGLIEATEGSDIAVNSSEELLSLYYRLFGNSKKPATKPAENASLLLPPKSSSGTIRSMSGSLFGRPRSLRRSLYKPDPNEMYSEGRPDSRPKTAISQRTSTSNAPTIQVTNENDAIQGSSSHGHHHPHLKLLRNDSHASGKLQKSGNSVRKQRSFGSFRRHRATRSDATTETERIISPAPQLPIFDRNNFQDRPESEISSTHLEGYNPRPSQVGLAVSPDIPSPAPSPQPSYQQLGFANRPSTNTHNEASQIQNGEGAGHTSGPNDWKSYRTVQLSTQVKPRLSVEEDGQLQTTMLVKIWLIVAKLYRRSQLYDDAKGAISEASELVEELELEISQDQSGSRKIDDDGWGCSRNVSELWGDVLTERGNLLKSQSLPYEALLQYEMAVSRCIDHPAGTVGLCSILLDISSRKLPPQFDTDSSTLQAHPNGITSFSSPGTIPDTPYLQMFQKLSVSSPIQNAAPAPLGLPHSSASSSIERKEEMPKVSRSSPEELDRLAARDRAYGLLTTLTKLGTGWDDSEAWYALSRAYEEGGQLDKAREALWWCVELEDARPIRAFKEVSLGSYVL